MGVWHPYNTLKAKDVPREMRVPSIHHGYRPSYRPWSYYLRSLFEIHNETVNVWSHLIGCAVIAYQIYTYYTLYSEHGSDLRWTTVAFGLCCLTTLFNSAVAHLLHSKSSYVNYLIFMYDYVGVVSWGFGTSILAVYGVSDPNVYSWLGPNFTLLQLVWTYVTYITICTTKLWFGHDLSNGRRKFMIVCCILAQASSNVIPWFPRYIKCFASDQCDISSLDHITRVCVSFVIMTLTFVLHQPERWRHNTFDIFGQSHQIFHVTVIITQVLQFRALFVDYQTKANEHCKPDIYHLLSHIFILHISCLTTIFLLRHRVKRTIEQNKHK